MDDIVFKTRYPRQSIPQSRRRTRRIKRARSSSKDKFTLLQRVRVQIVICMFILLLAGIIKSIDSPVTKFLQGRIKAVLSYDIEIKSILAQLNTFLNNSDNSEKGQLTEDDIIREKEDTSSDDMYVKFVNNVFDNKNELDNTGNSQDSVMVQSANYNGNEDTETQEPGTNKDMSFIIPVGGVVGSLYGERIHPISREVEFHKGIDIEALEGTPIKAAEKGEVIEEGESETYGKYIKLKHDDNIISLYAHCSTLLAKKGQIVNKGDTIAKVGNTGISKGAHLHFEIWKDGESVNPLDFIQSPTN
ncbi:MAG TPA: M23 family metallopeptidase [Acetivibrio sp.]|nr:M23 family metallopeptidase [Clostridium sp.]HOQ36327.1 M23 family metallopeptidase [Acetivibrio sp.]HPT91535.1 M23 family metallopeptidase [Acetivibrio sp.]